MSAKISAYRRGLFLKFLAETGNQTLAAERARVSRAWVCALRATDAGFDAACLRAIAETAATLSTPPHPPSADAAGPSLSREGRGASRWRYHEGHELVVAGSNGRRAQVRRARVGQWTRRVEQRFLGALSATCSVKAACAEVGMWPGSAYNHRLRWPPFAEAWDAAIEAGYAQLEEALVRAAEGAFAVPPVSVDGPVSAMSAAEALQLLNMHKHQVHGIGGRPGSRLSSTQEMERVRARLEEKMRRLGMLDGEEGEPVRGQWRGRRR